jgi:AraC-like DNA-binding protein
MADDALSIRESRTSRTSPWITHRTADLDDARAYMARVFRPHRLSLGPGERRIAMHHEGVKLDATSFHWLEYGANVTMSSAGMDGFYLFQMNLAGECLVRHGGEEGWVATGFAYLVNPNPALSKSWAPDCRQLIIRIDRGALERMVMLELGVDLTRPLEFSFRPHAAGGAIVMIAALAAALNTHGWLPRSRVAHHIETTLMASLLDELDHSYSEAFVRAEAACAPHYVRRAEEFIRAAAREPITSQDIAAAAGVSRRALYAGFRRFRDISPGAFLKSVRLELARQALEHAAGSETVTRVALNCGFTHMSKFARDFRRRFGRSPSATARRR